MMIKRLMTMYQNKESKEVSQISKYANSLQSVLALKRNKPQDSIKNQVLSAVLNKPSQDEDLGTSTK